MRIRLTLDIQRRRPDPEPQPEPPYIDDRGYAATERAEHHPIGFHAQPGRHDPEPAWEDHR